MPCLTEGCKKVAVYGAEYKKPLYCRDHKAEDMINSTTRQCKTVGCNKKPSYNLIGENRGLYCVAHKTSEMLDVVSKHCEFHGCSKQSVFNIRGADRGAYCKTHKRSDMIDIMTPKCMFLGCDVTANYNNKGEKRALFCATHKSSTMINVRSSKCRFSGCDKQPTYNVKGKKSGAYCRSHKNEEMVDIKHFSLCREPGCGKRPSFALPGETIGEYCKAHKSETMISTNPGGCKHPGCYKQPCFSLPGETITLYCSAHKGDMMTDTRNKSCSYLGCKKQPSFNFVGEKLGLYCSSHKLKGMTNIKDKRCAASDCDKIPCYNVPGTKRGLYCQSHKEQGMLIVTVAFCQIADCNKQASYRWPFSKVSHCGPHKCEGQIRKKERCLCGKLPTHSLTDLTEFFCFDCSRNKEELIDHRIACGKCELKMTPNYLFQEGEHLVCETCCENEVRCPASIGTPTLVDVQPTKKQRIEEVIVSLLEQKIASKSQLWHSAVVELQKDKAIGSSGCDSRRRPDVYLLLAGSNYPLKLIIEIDEYQHKSYSCECEQSRMLEIANEILVPGENERLVFVRLNPDSYKIKGKVKRSQRGKVEITKRVQELDRVVQLIYEKDIVLEEGKHCGVAYLYYDDYNGLELLQL
jgi:hypothetical protein